MMDGRAERERESGRAEEGVVATGLDWRDTVVEMCTEITSCHMIQGGKGEGCGCDSVWTCWINVALLQYVYF